MVHILRLISELQAGGTHTVVHRIHVNLTREGLALGCLSLIRVFVWVNGHLDFDLLAATLTDRLGKPQETGVWTGSLLGDEALPRAAIELG